MADAEDTETMTADRAREVLAAEYEAAGYRDEAIAFRAGEWTCHDHPALIALTKALQSAGEVRAEEWQDISTAPSDEPFMAGGWVTNNKTGKRWWETYIISIDDETGEAISWPEGEPLPWNLNDFEAWRPLPAPPSDSGGRNEGG